MQEGRLKVVTVFEGGPAGGQACGQAMSSSQSTGAAFRERPWSRSSASAREARHEGRTHVARDGRWGETRAFTVTRELIHGRSVWVSLIEPGYAYVRLSQFQVHTPETLVAGLSRFVSGKPRVTGICAGPARQSRRAAECRSRRVRRGPAGRCAGGVHRRHREGRKLALFAQGEDYLRHGATDYLQDGAGGAKDPADGRAGQWRVRLRCRDRRPPAAGQPAALSGVGTHTYGKGSVQVIIPFGDGTGMGHHRLLPHAPRPCYQGKGVMPDEVEGKAVGDAQAGPRLDACGPRSMKATRRARFRSPPCARRVGMPEPFAEQNATPDAVRLPVGARGRLPTRARAGTAAQPSSRSGAVSSLRARRRRPGGAAAFSASRRNTPENLRCDGCSPRQVEEGTMMEHRSLFA